MWSQLGCTPKGIVLPLPLLSPSGGIHWYSTAGCTERQDECFKRTVRAQHTSFTHCCRHPLCNIWARGPHPNGGTDWSISKPDLVTTGGSYPQRALCKNLRPLQVSAIRGLKPILAFKAPNFSLQPPLTTHLSNIFFKTISLLCSFCLIPLLVISSLQRSINVIPWVRLHTSSLV